MLIDSSRACYCIIGMNYTIQCNTILGTHTNRDSNRKNNMLATS